MAVATIGLICMQLIKNQKVVLAVDTIDVLAGKLPPRQQRLLEAWAELHHRELQDAWNALQADIPPSPIDPLR